MSFEPRSNSSSEEKIKITNKRWVLQPATASPARYTHCSRHNPSLFSTSSIFLLVTISVSTKSTILRKNALFFIIQTIVSTNRCFVIRWFQQPLLAIADHLDSRNQGLPQWIVCRYMQSNYTKSLVAILLITLYGL